MSARAVRSAILLAALGFVAALWIWRPWADTPHDPDDRLRLGTTPDRALRADEAGGADAGMQAALHGHPGETDVEERKRGPATVTVRGPGDRVLARVPVTLVGPKKDNRWVANQATVRDRESGEVRDAGVLQKQVLIPARLSTTVTDDAGVAVFPDVPYDGSHYVVLATKGDQAGLIDPPPLPDVTAGIFFNDSVDGMWPRENLFDRTLMEAQFPHRVPVTGPRVSLHVRVGLPLDVRIERAETGTQLGNVEWTAGPYFLGDQEQRLGPRELIAVEVLQSTVVTLRVRPPEGRALVDAPAFQTWISPRARSLSARVPLRPEVRLVLVLPEGVRISDPAALVGKIRMSGWVGVPRKLQIDGFGRLIATGMPHLQGETISVRMFSASHGLEGTARIGPNPETDVVVKLEASPYPRGVTVRPQRTWGHPTTATLATTSLFDTPATGLRMPPVGWTSAAKGGPETGRLDIHVRGPDGRPATSALVYLADRDRVLVTGSDGRVLFRGLDIDTTDVIVSGAGVPMTRQVPITAGKTARLTLHGHAGGRVDVTVVDAEGDPVPYAQLTVTQPSSVTWIDLQDGVQRVDPFTNHRGERTLNTVEPGRVVVSASFGSRRANDAVEVVRGKTVPLRLVLERNGAKDD